MSLIFWIKYNMVRCRFCVLGIYLAYSPGFTNPLLNLVNSQPLFLQFFFNFFLFLLFYSHYICVVHFIIKPQFLGTISPFSLFFFSLYLNFLNYWHIIKLNGSLLISDVYIHIHGETNKDIHFGYSIFHFGFSFWYFS